MKSPSSPRGVRATGGVASRERRSVSSPEFLARDGRPAGRTLGAVGGALPRRRDGGGFEPASSDAAAAAFSLSLSLSPLLFQSRHAAGPRGLDADASASRSIPNTSSEH